MAPTVMVTARNRVCSSRAVLDFVLVAIIVLLLPLANASDPVKSPKSVGDPADSTKIVEQQPSKPSERVDPLAQAVSVRILQAVARDPEEPTNPAPNSNPPGSLYPQLLVIEQVDEHDNTCEMILNFVTELQKQFASEFTAHPEILLCQTLKQLQHTLEKNKDACVKYEPVVLQAKFKLDSKLAQRVDLKTKWNSKLRGKAWPKTQVDIDQLFGDVDELIMELYNLELNASLDAYEYHWELYARLTDELAELNKRITVVQDSCGCCGITVGKLVVAGAIGTLLYNFNSAFHDLVNGIFGQVTTLGPEQVSPWTPPPTTESVYNRKSVLTIGSILVALFGTNALVYYYLIYRRRTSTSSTTTDGEASHSDDSNQRGGKQEDVPKSNGKVATLTSKSKSKVKSAKVVGTSPTDTLPITDGVKSKSKSKPKSKSNRITLFSKRNSEVKTAETNSPTFLTSKTPSPKSKSKSTKANSTTNSTITSNTQISSQTR